MVRVVNRRPLVKRRPVHALREPLGPPGLSATYEHPEKDRIPPSSVKAFELVFGTAEKVGARRLQWLGVHATKANGDEYRFWLLTKSYPPRSLAGAHRDIARYVLQEGGEEAVEFSHRYTGRAVLPCLGAWRHLIPRSLRPPRGRTFPKEMAYLGHVYRLSRRGRGGDLRPPRARVIKLLPDVLVGVPHNTKVRDDARRYDGSDYEYVRLAPTDFDEMIDAGMNCFRVDAEQAGWIRSRDVFYWGPGARDIKFPEELYRSNYLGPEIFLDEPAVCTRDHVIKPSLENDPALRRELTVEKVLGEFIAYFRKANRDGTPTHLIRGLRSREDLDLGDMWFLQQNVFSWETMVSTAAWQLGQERHGPPCAVVFEPPGRFGTMRTLPEMDMAYGCQIPVDDPKALASIIFGFLRGAARLTKKAWGVSIYGQVDRADAPWLLTHAYDLGAQFFFYWDSHQLACVPRREYLALSRILRGHVENHPLRDAEALRNAAEVLVLLPAGYNLGHVDMGRGNLWGLGELNLERPNSKGVKHRVVMGNFFTEIERLIRLGVAFDLAWDLPGLDLRGYREIVRIGEDGDVRVLSGGSERSLGGPRRPARPDGTPPRLELELSRETGRAPMDVVATAVVEPGSAAVYYSTGADSEGVYRNAVVMWELFGPGEEDYLFMNPSCPCSIKKHRGGWNVKIRFRLSQPGAYRLRAATVDLAGRTAAAWKAITVKA